MTAMLVKSGEVLYVGGELDRLAQYAMRKGVRVDCASLIRYVNGFASLYVRYTDSACGTFTGINAFDVEAWVRSQKKWPRCLVSRVSVPWVRSPGEEAPSVVKSVEPAPTPYVRRVTRSRRVVRRVHRSR